jgi:hypothetical protein
MRKNAVKGTVAGIAATIATCAVAFISKLDSAQKAALVPVIAAGIVALYDAIKHRGKK